MFPPFSEYVGAQTLPPHIANSPELRLIKRQMAIGEELASLRNQTIKFSHVSTDGKMVVDRTPAFEALQARITEKEQALEKLAKLAERIEKILQENGVESVHALEEHREAHASTISSGPYRTWDEFRLHRERPIGQGGHPHLLPSDLAKVESYKAIEDGIRADMDQAKAALKPIDAAREKISSLVSEANRL